MRNLLMVAGLVLIANATSSCKQPIVPQDADQLSISDGAGAMRIAATPSIPLPGNTQSRGVCFYKQIGNGTVVKEASGSANGKIREVRYKYESMHGEKAIADSALGEFADSDYSLPNSYKAEKKEIIAKLGATLSECEYNTPQNFCQQNFMRDLDAANKKLLVKHKITKEQLNNPQRLELVKAINDLNYHFQDSQNRPQPSASSSTPVDYLSSENPEVYKYATAKIAELSSSIAFKSKETCNLVISQVETEQVK